MSDLLTPDDVAYMRETQADARPTEATIRLATPGGSDGMGGTTPASLADPEPIQVRVDDDPDVPADLAGRFDVPLVKIVTDLVTIPMDSVIQANGAKYRVVSTYRVGEWTTAQIVWAVGR